MLKLKIRETAAAAILAIVLSSTAIIAAVGPAAAIESGPAIAAPARVA